MAITTYEGLLQLGTNTSIQPISVNLYRGDNGVSILYPLESFYCSSAEQAEAILEGTFDRNATLFVRYPGEQEFFESMGFPSVYRIYSGTRIYFSNGRQIRFSINSSNEIWITHSMNGETLEYGCAGSATSDTEMTTTASSSVSPHMALALMSERVYSYTSVKSRTVNGITTTLTTPVQILASPAVQWHGKGFFVPTHYSPNKGTSVYGSLEIAGAQRGNTSYTTTYLYPVFPYCSAGDEYMDVYWVFDQTNKVYTVKEQSGFNNKVQFLTDFWSGIGEKQYTATVTQTVGGTVTPSGFFARANAGKAFVVKPDAHHAIHSVTGYRTDTNSRFVFEESSTNLQTGAKTYLFNMPSSDIRIVVEFKSIETTIPVTVTYTGPRDKKYATSFNLTYDNPG